jgi:hypothetical protein
VACLPVLVASTAFSCNFICFNVRCNVM